jgi:hypothetical protein
LSRRVDLFDFCFKESKTFEIIFGLEGFFYLPFSNLHYSNLFYLCDLGDLSGEKIRLNSSELLILINDFQDNVKPQSRVYKPGFWQKPGLFSTCK